MLQFLIIQTSIIFRIFKPPFPPRKTTLVGEYLFLESWIGDDGKGREGKDGELFHWDKGSSGLGTFFESFRRKWGRQDRDDSGLLSHKNR
jgi:hypothetical protein